MKRKLTRNSRRLIILVLALSGIVIFSLLLYLSIDPTLLTQAPAIVILLSAIIAIAIIAVLYSRTRRKDYTKLLEGDYYVRYEALEDRLQNSTLSTLERKDVLQDVLNLLLDAQQNQKAAHQVIDEDVDDFARQIESAFGHRMRWIFVVCDGILYSLIYAFTLHITNFVRDQYINFFTVRIPVSLIFFIIAIAFIVIPMIKSGLSSKKFIRMIAAPALLLILYIGINELIYARFLHIPWAYQFLEGTFRLVPNAFFLILWPAIAISSIIMKRFIRMQSVQKASR